MVLSSALALEVQAPFVNFWEMAAGESATRFPNDGSVAHAGEVETSLMLAVSPTFVGQPRAEFERPTDGELLTIHMGPSGVIGDARKGKGGAGQAFFDSAVAGLVRYIDTVLPAAQGAQ